MIRSQFVFALFPWLRSRVYFLKLMPRFPIARFARMSLRRHPLWIGLLLCAHLLAGFPGSGPMLTSLRRPAHSVYARC